VRQPRRVFRQVKALGVRLTRVGQRVMQRQAAEQSDSTKEIL
jgi:hypothetical protein